MLHCPRCSSTLMVQDLMPHHCNEHCPPPKCSPPPNPRPLYQNVCPPVPPRRVPPLHPTSDPIVSPALQLMQKDAALQVELAALQFAIAEKQLEQKRLQQELLRQPLASPSPSPSWQPSGPWFSPQPCLPLPRPQADLEVVLAATQAQLEQCGWYYGALSWQESAHLLQDTPEGTFLVRDSQAKEGCYRYSLSVQRRREDLVVNGRVLKPEGPTSVRIQFVNGEFRLDADGKIRDLMPVFPSVIELVSYYVALSRSKGRREVLIEQEEQEASGLVSGLLLRAPLLKEAPRLGHLARLAIHKAMEGGVEEREKERRRLQLPQKLYEFLDSYPQGI